MKIVTWNVNSLRLRLPLVEKLTDELAPDVLCLQETKCPDELVPHEDLHRLGWSYVAHHGQKGYNGVAILSRVPIVDLGHEDWCAKGDARHVAAGLPDGTVLHNFYVPAGGDEPNPETNPKFAHKLGFVQEMEAHFAPRRDPAILVGDLNIAPREDDVWSHKQLLKVVSHTPIEVERLTAAQEAGGWTDVVRALIPEGKLYSWWSYRARDWDAADKGRRLDHVWATGGVEAKARAARILRDARGWEKPSDHAPVFAEFDL